MPWLIIIYMYWLTIINVVTAGAYIRAGMAVRRRRPVPERRLVWLNIAGGALFAAWPFFFFARLNRIRPSALWRVQSACLLEYLGILGLLFRLL
jgi:hypothetical protein